MATDVLDRIEMLACKATPTPAGHPLPDEYVIWIDDKSRYTASGTIHDAALLAAARDVLHAVAVARAEREARKAAEALIVAAESVRAGTGTVPEVASARVTYQNALGALHKLGVEV